MGAVAVVVVRSRVSVDEIDEPRHALRRARAPQVVVPGGDARVDHCDADPGTVVAERLSNGEGADGCGGSLHRAGDLAVDGDGFDPRRQRQRFERGVRQLAGVTVDDREVARGPAAKTSQRCFHRAARRAFGGTHDDVGASASRGGPLPQQAIEFVRFAAARRQ
jgi:hypothetical protein